MPADHQEWKAGGNCLQRTQPMFGIEAECIRNKKEQILGLWEARCLQEVTSARSSSSLALRNSLPLYLAHLSDALATNRRMDLRSVSLHDEEATRIGKLHGADRATNRSYTLSEVLVEYHILREVLFQVLEAEGPLAQGPRDIVLDSIEQAVNDAVVKFTTTYGHATDIHSYPHSRPEDSDLGGPNECQRHLETCWSHRPR